MAAHLVQYRNGKSQSDGPSALFQTHQPCQSKYRRANLHTRAGWFRLQVRRAWCRSLLAASLRAARSCSLSENDKDLDQSHTTTHLHGPPIEADSTPSRQSQSEL